MLNFNSILLFSENSEALSNFYKNVLQKDPDMAEEGYFGYKVGNGFITIGPHDRVKGKSSNPERILINLETEDVEGEFDRVKGISGAAVVKEPYHPGESPDMSIATFADPDGNYFQLMTPFKGEM